VQCDPRCSLKPVRPTNLHRCPQSSSPFCAKGSPFLLCVRKLPCPSRSPFVIARRRSAGDHKPATLGCVLAGLSSVDSYPSGFFVDIRPPTVHFWRLHYHLFLCCLRSLPFFSSHRAPLAGGLPPPPRWVGPPSCSYSRYLQLHERHPINSISHVIPGYLDYVLRAGHTTAAMAYIWFRSLPRALPHR